MSGKPTLLVPGKATAYGIEEGESGLSYIQRWVRSRMLEYGSGNVNLSNRVLIVQSETGSGKSTALPVGMFRILRNEESTIRYQGLNVMCTQPKVLTAKSLAEDVSSKPFNKDMILGETVGYRTGPFKVLPKKGLIYATAGSLREELNTNDDMTFINNYKIIMVDEAHERSEDCDMLLMLLRNFYMRNANVQTLPFLLLMSATFNPSIYVKYFGISERNVVKITGRTYNINTHWHPENAISFVDAIIAKTKYIHETFLEDTPDKADVLIFVPGTSEARVIMEEFQKLNDGYEGTEIPNFACYFMNRERVNDETEEYELVMMDHSKLPKINGKLPFRRVTLSTTVAETGLTINTLKYVIDCGYAPTPEIYFPYCAGGLLNKPAPQSRIKQRKGRVGRLFEGEFYPIYTEETYNAILPMQMPDILQTGIMNGFIRLIAEQRKHKKTMGDPNWETFRVEDITLLEPPSISCLLTANSLATELGFVSLNKSRTGFSLTDMGILASKMDKISMETIRLIFSTYFRNVAISDLITIAAIFKLGKSIIKRGSDKIKLLNSIMPNFLLHGNDDDVVVRTYLLFADDFIINLFAFDAFTSSLSKTKNMDDVIEWCEESQLKFEFTNELMGTRSELLTTVSSAGINCYHNEEFSILHATADTILQRIIDLKKCIFDGYRKNLLTLAENKYVSRQGLEVDVHPYDKALFKMNKKGRIPNPNYLISNDFNISSRGDYVHYKVSGDLISVVDGYYIPDIEFNL